MSLRNRVLWLSDSCCVVFERFFWLFKADSPLASESLEASVPPTTPPQPSTAAWVQESALGQREIVLEAAASMAWCWHHIRQAAPVGVPKGGGFDQGLFQRYHLMAFVVSSKYWNLYEQGGFSKLHLVVLVVSVVNPGSQCES